MIKEEMRLKRMKMQKEREARLKSKSMSSINNNKLQDKKLLGNGMNSITSSRGNYGSEMTNKFAIGRIGINNVR